jgi:hypothetical protein
LFRHLLHQRARAEIEGDKIIISPWQKAILLLAFSCLSCQKQTGLPIDFYKEQVNIEVSADQARVTGEYFFKNLTGEAKKIIFYYPFPVDSVQLYPSPILLDFPFTKDTTGLEFVLSIGSKAEERFKITYVQSLKVRRFRYITTTTREWRRAIKEAKFIVTAPRDLHLKINYPVAKTIERGNNNIYTIIRKQFYPDTDLVITW